MLSSVLTSDRVLEVNILIVCAFVKFREIISTHKKVAVALIEIKQKLKSHDAQITKIIRVIN